MQAMELEETPLNNRTAKEAVATVTVSSKAVKSLARRHPWVFSGAVLHAPADRKPGDTVAVRSQEGRFLAWGAWSPQSQIRIRVWSFNPDDSIDEGWIEARLAEALFLRRHLPLPEGDDALRLVNAESDGLPGLIVDRYAQFLVCQFLSAGVERWRTPIAEALERLTGARGIYERSDVAVRAKEGLAPRTGLLWGDAPPEMVEIRLNGTWLLVDVLHGHKTGFYLDQRENHARITAFAAGRRVLNCFCYSGAFGLMALAAGAQNVVQVDAGADVLALARRNLALNRLDAARVEHLEGNVFEILRRYRDNRSTFDLIVLDPPKFVASAGQLNKGARGYKEINLLAIKMLAPGGILITFSCSGLVDPPLFQKIVSDAAADACRTMRIIARLDQSADHPVDAAFPEGHYLKGLVCVADQISGIS